jgi:hypothetical protein
MKKVLLPAFLMGLLVFALAGCNLEQAEEEHMDMDGEEWTEEEMAEMEMDGEHMDNEEMKAVGEYTIEEWTEEEMAEMEMEGEHMDMEEEETTSEEIAYVAPRFVDYTEDVYAASVGTEPTVLFFHANWCPTCVLMEKNINAELSDFPDGTNIIQIDYDNSTDLKTEYGVTSQSTIIILDASGAAINKLAAPSNSQLKSAIGLSL